ncbi:MAG: RND family transporter [Sphaerochaeta sp.]|uniref:efflux RND transporter permease subunit n=1 Tax=Sphaerochaeta sp. TaxID=1972642 RepID=UPI003D13C04A
MQSLIRWVIRHTRLTLLIIALITVAACTLLPFLSLNSEYINLLPPEEEHAQLRKEVLQDSGQLPGDLYILFEGDQVFGADALNALDEVLQNLTTIPALKPPFSAFSFLTVQKKGSRLITLPLRPEEEGVLWTDASAKEFAQRLQSDAIARNLLSTKEGNALLFQLSFREAPSQPTALHQGIASLVDGLSEYGKVSIIGTPLFEDRVLYYLSKDLKSLLLLCLLVIVLLFYLAFHSKRAVLLPLSLSVIALVWTLASMVVLGYELTVVNIIVPSMVLILGSSYAIHVLHEYFRSQETNEKQEQIIVSVLRISSTIFGACLTTIIGFLSLLACKLKTFQELGVSVSLGIFYCAVLSLVYLPAMLSLLPAPKPRSVMHFNHGWAAHSIHRMSVTIVRRYPIALVVLCLMVLAFLFTNHQVTIDTDYLTYFPKADPLITDSISFAKKIGGSDPHYITLTAPDNQAGYFLRPEVLAAVHAFEQSLLEHNKDITFLFSFSRYVAFLNEVYQNTPTIPETPGLLLMLSRLLTVAQKRIAHPMLSSLLNDQASRMTITIRSYDSRYESWESLESVETLQHDITRARSLLPDGIQIQDWGVGVDALRMSRTIQGDQQRSLLLSLVLVGLVVLAQFASLGLALLALVPTLFGIMANYLFMYLARIPFDVVTIIFATVTVGVGVDAAIHFLVRFTFIRKNRPSLPDAVLLARTLEETARPIVLTSGSLVLGLLVLLFASFVPIKYFGLLLAIALLGTAFATLCILPALLLVFGFLKHNKHGH